MKEKKNSPRAQTMQDVSFGPVLVTATLYHLVLPKFSSELMQRTGTDGTEPKVRFSPVPVLQFWLRFGSQFSEFSKIPEPFENQSKFTVGIQKKPVK